MTFESMESYWAALGGEKTWIMPYENPTASNPEEELFNAAVEKLLKQGFREISEPEYLWLLKVTTCPDDILRNPPCNINVLKTGKIFKYYLCSASGAPCSSRESTILGGYVQQSRNGEKDIEPMQTHASFFGTGDIGKRRFCHNGKIWNGD